VAVLLSGRVRPCYPLTGTFTRTGFSMPGAFEADNKSNFHWPTWGRKERVP